MKSNTDNPAGRLLEILEKAKKLSQSQDWLTNWSALLETPKENRILLIGRIGGVMALCSEIHESLTKIEDYDETRGLSWSNNLITAFNEGPKSWSGFVQRINDPVLDGLYAVSHVISRSCPEPTVAKEELDQINNETLKMIDFIKNSALHSELKSYLVGQLRSLLATIDSYQIGGGAPIQAVMEQITGHLVLNQNKISSEDESQKNAIQNILGFTSRVFEYLKKPIILIGVSADAVQLIDFLK